MRKRPVLVTILYWGLVALLQLYPPLSCGIGAGWSEESHQAITDCYYVAEVRLIWVNVAAIAIYAAWAVITIRGLKRTDGV